MKPYIQPTTFVSSVLSTESILVTDSKVPVDPTDELDQGLAEAPANPWGNLWEEE